MIKSQFTCFPLVWMFCSKTLNKFINKTHKCAFISTLNDDESSFEELLQESTITNHQSNIQSLLTEVFKTIINLVPPIIKGMFKAIPNNYNLINFQKLVTEKT